MDRLQTLNNHLGTQPENLLERYRKMSNIDNAFLAKL